MNWHMRLALVITAILMSPGAACAELRDAHGHRYTVSADDPPGRRFELSINVEGASKTDAETSELKKLWKTNAKRLCGGGYSGTPDKETVQVTNWDGFGANGEMVGGQISTFGGISGTVTCRHGA